MCRLAPLASERGFLLRGADDYGKIIESSTVAGW
jgi:hypothetical protein